MDLLEREEPLEAFTGALRDAAAGRGRVLLVRGEAGIGKTALVHHALSTRASGARVLLAGCDDLATARPLGPFRDLAPDVGDVLAERLRDRPTVDEVLEPLVAELQRPPRPVVLWIDDVHWADEASLDLLTLLLRRLDRLPALVVLSFRTGIDAGHPLRSVVGRLAAPPAVHLDLGPLSREAVTQLGGRHDPDELWRRTHGNPFLVTAMVRHDEASVPPTVQDAMLAELADLTPSERSLVELAAVVPNRIETRVLDACRPGWEDHGTRPEQRGLLEVRDGTVAFRHELARLAVFEALPAARRRQLHRDVLRVLREQGDEPARLVHHAIGADDVDTLLSAGPEAARTAAGIGAHRQALQHYERLVVHDARLERLDRASLWAEYGAELMTANELSRSREAFARAAELYEGTDDVEGLGRSLVFLSGLAWIHHEPDESDRLEEEAIARLEATDPVPQLAHAYSRRAARFMTRWVFHDAEQWARRALAVAEELAHGREMAYARIMLGTSLVTRGEVEEGLARLDESIRIAERIRAFNLVSLAYGNAAESLLDVGRPDLAGPYVERGRQLADRRETLSVGGYLAGVQARLLAVRGEYGAAVDLARSVWSGGQITAVNELVAALALGRAMLRRGDDAGSVLALATEVGRTREEIQYYGPATALRAEAAWLSSEPAPDDLGEVLDDARVIGQPWLLGDLTTWAWRLGVRVELPAEAPAPFGRVVERDPVGASREWGQRGYAYERLLVLVDSEDPDVVRGAVEAADLLGAVPLATRLRQRLRELGVRRIPRGPQPATRENPSGLTDRQLEVLRHVAAGRTNAEIAASLVVSVRTVDHHVSATLGKLGVTSRREAAELAAELGIVPAG